MNAFAISRPQLFNLQFALVTTHHKAHYGEDLTDFFPFRA